MMLGTTNIKKLTSKTEYGMCYHLFPAKRVSGL